VALDAGAVVGNYRVERVLGRGGMGTVYAARHVQHGRQVALKLIAAELSHDPDFVARFRREGRMQASLEHPHVVTVFEAGESEHGLYLAMRLVPGPTLASLVADRSLDAPRALALLRQVADGLDAAHAAGLVHRDVKPQNVLVGEADDAYLGDFGLTRLGGAATASITDALVGTVSYLAPEVIRGDEAGPASDRYAFGAMVFECLTGTVVYPRQTQAAVLYAHTSEPPPRASGRRPELPPALDEIFERALAKDPGTRPASATELIDAVSAKLNGAGPVLGPPPPPGVIALADETGRPNPVGAPVAAPHPRGRAWLLGGLLAAALAGAAVAAAATALVGGDEDDPPAAPATLPGTRVLGSDLSEPGRAVTCRLGVTDHAVPSCTIMQTDLPGRTIVVPEDGVVRRWGVRSARGELVLAVIRPRGEDTLQVSRSQHEFAGSSGVHLFETELAVERGDVLGLVALPGSASGLRGGVEGARSTHFTPAVFGGDQTAGRPGDELLLRVEYVPGGQQRRPEPVTGAAAADLPAGRVVERTRLRFNSGRPVEIALVALGDRFVLDQFLNGRRTARIDVPADLGPETGSIVTFYVAPNPGVQESIGIYIEYRPTGSARILNHYFGTSPHGFDFVN
jgi:serine/threonine-protein kinase